MCNRSRERNAIGIKAVQRSKAAAASLEMARQDESDMSSDNDAAAKLRRPGVGQRLGGIAASTPQKDAKPQGRDAKGRAGSLSRVEFT